MSVQYYIPPHNSTVNYKKFDPVLNVFVNNTTYPTPYYFATQDNIGQVPFAVFNFPLTTYNRSDDVTVLTFNQTGNVPNIVTGSIIKITGVMADPTVNYTGMAIEGGSGGCKFINPGWPASVSLSTGAINCQNPAFTTGFFFIPTYSSKIPTENKVISAKFGDGYEQRTSAGLNTFSQSCRMVFQSRSNREMKAIMTFVQDRAGVYPFEILIPDQFINNQPNQKYVSPSAEETPVSYGLFDVNVTMNRVFDL